MREKIEIVIVTCIVLLGPLVVSEGDSIFFKDEETFTSFKCALSHRDAEYDLVIIAPDAFFQPLQPLVEHKNSYGIKTSLKATEDIYRDYEGRDSVEKIKYFIKDAIENWHIKYALLVGGFEQLPSRYTHIYFDDFYLYQTPNEWVFSSDLYYADIYTGEMEFSSWDTNGNNVFAEYNWHGNTDECDLHPDVYLGRLACINEEEVATCVSKIIRYEVEDAYTQDWFTNLIVIGGDSLPGDQEAVDEGEYVNEKVLEIMDGFIPIKLWASNGKLYDALNINEAIDNGAGFVFFNGHGNVDIWATHPHENAQVWIPSGSYTNSHIRALSNGYKLPIVISDACYHCKYDTSSDCFGWTFLTNPNGGAIAFLGGTDIDLSYGGTDIITKGVEKLCVEISKHYRDGVLTLGELIGKSLETYMSSNMDEIDIITVMENQLFGDPTLKVGEKSQPPNKPSPPRGPPSGKTRIEYTYKATTIDPDGDQVYYLFDWGDGTTSTWLGPFDSGIEINASHTWLDMGFYDIKVISKDSHGVMSEWSDPLSVSMPKNFIVDLNGGIQWLLKGNHIVLLLLRIILGILI